MIQFAMVVFEVRDLQRTIVFHRLLGLDVPDPEPDRPVALYRMPNGVSFVFTVGFAAINDPDWSFPEHGYRQMLEFVVPDDASVDALWTTLTDAGHHGRKAPGKTTGPYAAMVDDPDGNVVLISSDVAAIAPSAA